METRSIDDPHGYDNMTEIAAQTSGAHAMASAILATHVPTSASATASCSASTILFIHPHAVIADEHQVWQSSITERERQDDPQW